MIINGSLELEKSSIESLGNIREIHGDLSLFKTNNIESLGNLEKVKGSLFLTLSNVKSLGKLKFVGRTIVISDFIESLEELKRVNCFLKANNCKNLISLGKLEKVKHLDVSDCINLKDLGNLKEAKTVRIWNSGITKEIMKQKYPKIFYKAFVDFGGGN